MSQQNPEVSKPEAKTDVYYELRINELQKQLQIAQDQLKTANEELTVIRKGDVEKLIDEIVKVSTFTLDELKDKSREELILIRAAIDKAPGTRKGIQPGSHDSESQETGLTAGRWDGKGWVT